MVLSDLLDEVPTWQDGFLEVESRASPQSSSQRLQPAALRKQGALSKAVPLYSTYTLKPMCRAILDRSSSHSQRRHQSSSSVATDASSCQLSRQQPLLSAVQGLLGTRMPASRSSATICSTLEPAASTAAAAAAGTELRSTALPPALPSVTEAGCRMASSTCSRAHLQLLGYLVFGCP